MTIVCMVVGKVVDQLTGVFCVRCPYVTHPLLVGVIPVSHVGIRTNALG